MNQKINHLPSCTGIWCLRDRLEYTKTFALGFVIFFLTETAKINEGITTVTNVSFFSRRGRFLSRIKGYKDTGTETRINRIFRKFFWVMQSFQKRKTFKENPNSIKKNLSILDKCQTMKDGAILCLKYAKVKNQVNLFARTMVMDEEYCKVEGSGGLYAERSSGSSRSAVYRWKQSDHRVNAEPRSHTVAATICSSSLSDTGERSFAGI